MYDPAKLRGKRVAFALTGSYCTLKAAVEAIAILRDLGCVLLPVISYSVRDLDSRFGSAAYWRTAIAEAAGCTEAEIIDTIAAAEPLGPKNMSDLLIVAPCSGNTLAKLAHGVTDTPVLMAIKSHLRGGRPVALAISSNDALAGGAQNLGRMLNARNFYFVPFRQDDPERKPRSLSADLQMIPQTLAAALDGCQIQPILRGY